MNNKGFTLIELLISIMIMAILFTAGYSNFSQFNRKQTLYKAQRQVEGDVRIARQKALSGEGLDNCNTGEKLKGYRFDFDYNEYSISAVCNTNSITLDNYEDIELPNGTYFDNSDGVTFTTVKGSTTLENDMEIILALDGSNDTVTIDVKKTGEISLSK